MHTHFSAAVPETCRDIPREELGVASRDVHVVVRVVVQRYDDSLERLHHLDLVEDDVVLGALVRRRLLHVLAQCLPLTQLFEPVVVERYDNDLIVSHAPATEIVAEQVLEKIALASAAHPGDYLSVGIEHPLLQLLQIFIPLDSHNPSIFDSHVQYFSTGMLKASHSAASFRSGFRSSFM